jgi:hypothetical protein
MSRIYFHNQATDTAELRGSERAYMGCLVNDLALAALHGLEGSEEWLKPVLPADHYLQRYTGHEFARSARTWFNVQGKMMIGGDEVDAWTVALNTALLIGGDAIKLLTRLHAQCEIHCWVEGRPDKNWLAGIISNGLETGIMREGQGWEDVIGLLRHPGGFPIVCSYSVCEQFPNFGCLPDDHLLKTREDDARFDAFYELPDDEKWSICLDNLRATQPLLRITQSDWNTYRLYDGLNAFNLRKRISAAKKEAA